VEDNDLNRQIFTELLSSQGYSVVSASNGQLALEAIEQQRIQGQRDEEKTLDLVLMDLRMPGMDGYETARRIRRIEGLETIPIIAMSADARNTVREEIIAAGMDDFISKPIDPPDFLRSWNDTERKNSRIRGHRRLIRFNPPLWGGPFPERLPALSITDGIRRIGGNEGFYKTILADFLQPTEEKWKIASASLGGKYTELELAAHTLKGAAATIGATEVADAADRLQRNAVNYERGNHQNDLRDQLAELDKLMDTLWGSIDILQRWRFPHPEDNPSFMAPPVLNPLPLHLPSGNRLAC